MTKKAKTASNKVRDAVRDGMRGLGSVGSILDDELDPSDLGGGLFSRKTKGEIIKDRLIESYRSGAGWYIKLDKDIGGNEWQFKDKIISYDDWTNFELGLNEFVRAKAESEMKKTGQVKSYSSGRYRASFWNEQGDRGEQEYHIFNIDSKEYELEVPKTFAGHPGATDVNELVKTIQASALNPSETAQRQFEAMKMGMELAVGKEAKAENSNNALLTGMFSMMGSVIAALAGKSNGPDPLQLMNDMVNMQKNLGLLPEKKDPPPQKSYIEMINELKAMGINVGNPSDDIATQITKFKNMMELFRPLVGSGGGGEGERPPLWERVIEQHGGKLIDLVSAFTKMNGNGNGAPAPRVMPQRMPVRTMPRSEPIPEHASSQSEGGMDPFADTAAEPEPASVTAVEQTQVQTTSEENAEMIALIGKFAAELKDAVENDRTEKFPYIASVIGKFYDSEKADFYIKIGHVTADQIIGQIVTLDSKSYVDSVMKQKLISYVNRFIEWVRSQGTYYALCSSCQDYKDFESKAAFEAEQDKTCGQALDGNVVCQGSLQAAY